MPQKLIQVGYKSEICENSNLIRFELESEEEEAEKIAEVQGVEGVRVCVCATSCLN